MTLYSGGSYYDDAYNDKYGGNPPSFQDDYNSNTSWFNDKGLLQDTGLIDKGYKYFEGSADTSADKLREAGYITAGEAGSTLSGGQNAWYLAPASKASAPTASSGGGGGGGGGASSYTAKAPVIPEPPKVYNTKTGSSLGGLITGTLGSMSKSPFDSGAKGLKGLTTGKGKDTPTPSTDTDRKKFRQGMFSTGVSVPSSGIGVQV